MEKKYDINYEHNGDSVLFKNNVRVSRMQFDALHRVRGFYTDSTPSFFWQELLRVTEANNSMIVKFSPISLKRFQREMDYLADSGFFKMERSEIDENGRKKIIIRYTDIHPALISIVHLL